jgi:hypothetical protein
MTSRAYFGLPQTGFVPGGTHITVYVVPVFEGRLVVFDVSAREARGRWLPWNVLPFQGNPYITASELVDEWCGGMVGDLRLVDVMSFEMPGGGWELAIVFRAALTAEPQGDDVRTPFIFEKGKFDAIGAFDPVDIERWVTGAEEQAPASDAGGLLF